MKNKNLNLAHYYINEYINEHDLVWQLREIKDKGFNGLVLSPAKGLEIGFMSPEWLSITNFILMNCEDLNLMVYLSTDSVNPTNIFEAKYHFDEKDYKMFYMSLMNLIPISEYTSLTSEKDDIFYIMKNDVDGEIDPTSALKVELNSQDVQKLKNKKVLLAKFSVTDANRVPNDLYPFNFLIKNTTQEFVEKVYKRSFTIFNRYTSFAGFYEPRLFPNMKSDSGIVWNDLLLNEFSKREELELGTVIPELFFSSINKYQKIRERYDKFILEKYKTNFIDVVEQFVTEHNINIIYQFDSKISKKSYHNYFDFTPLYNLENYIGKKSTVAYYLPYIGNNEIDMTDIVFFQSLKSLEIINRSIAIITDKHHRFNFTPHRFINLRKCALSYNVTDTITESFLYSIKGFRKNDIVPNIFYQNRFWKYITKANEDFDMLLKETIKEDSVLDVNYDVIVVYSDVERYNKYYSKDYQHEFYDNFVDALKISNKSVFIIPSDMLDNLKLKKSNGNFSFSYKYNESEINTDKLVMVYGEEDSNIEKWHKKNCDKVEILKVGIVKKSIDNKLDIFDKNAIIKYLNDCDSSLYTITTESGSEVVVNRFDKDGEDVYFALNSKLVPSTIKFTNCAGEIFSHKLENAQFKIFDKNSIVDCAKVEPATPTYKIILKNNWQFACNGSNILPLTQWLFKVGGPKDEFIGTVHYFETQFISNIIPNKLFLILDGVYGEKDSVHIEKPVKIIVNDNEVSANFQKLEFAHTLYKVDISEFVTKGENKIIIKSKGTHFTPITLNEPQFLEGDFVIRKKLNDLWVIDKQEKPLFDGNWVANGYPYYYGVGEFSQYFMIEKNFKRINLKIENYDYPIEIKINDEYVTSLISPPYEFDVTDFITEGKNKLVVVTPSSVANIFTGIKLPEGMVGEVSLEVF